jgi:hypothetical protein
VSRSVYLTGIESQHASWRKKHVLSGAEMKNNKDF